MPRQLIQPFEVIYNILGTQPAAGGSVLTYEIGTTTPKLTYADYALSIPNANPVPLDASGRVDSPIWGDGEYTLVIRNADDETIKSFDSRPEQPAGAAIPIPNPGEFLTGDGSNILTELVRQVPDPTGSSAYLLTNDGANALWASAASVITPLIPPVPEPEWSETTDSLRLGDFLIQVGTVTASGTGGHRATATVTFPITYTSTPRVFAQNASYSTTPHNATGTTSVTGQSTTGATINYDVNVDSNNSGWNISSPPTIHWLAIGVKTS